MEQPDKSKTRSASDSEPPTQKKKNKINTSQGPFKRSHSEIQGRDRAVQKEEPKNEPGAGTVLMRTKNGKRDKEPVNGEHKRAVSTGHPIDKEKEKEKEREKKKKKDAAAAQKDNKRNPVPASPQKERRAEKLKEKIKESLFLQKKKKKTTKENVHNTIDNHDIEKKKPKKKPKKKKAPEKKVPKEKAKSDSEGSQKWVPTESFRMKMESEFEELEEEDRKKRRKRDQEWYPALEYHNISKNRYNNVLPNPETRVKLQNTDGSGDYINANYVQGPRETYIACQAPLPNTFDDFWRMVWEQKVYVIMMLTRLKERDRVKAEQYWPSVGPLGRTRVFIPLRSRPSSGRMDSNESSSSTHDDELIQLLNRASNGGHDGEGKEKEKEPENKREKGEKEKERGEKEKEKTSRKALIREAEYTPHGRSNSVDEEQTESTTDEDSDNLILDKELKSRREGSLAFHTDWGTGGLEDEGEESGFTDYGVIGVRLQKTIPHSKKFTIRQFYIRHAEEKTVRRVVQIHYTGWPDFGAPKSTKAFHTLLSLMESYKKEAPDECSGPTVLHCSAGLGRTGTLIAAHIALEELRLGRVRKSQVDLKQIVTELREQRTGMVQTKEQYMFLNELVREYSARSLYV